MRVSVVLILLALAGCGALPPLPQPPQVPPNLYAVNGDLDTGAINQAAWAFGVAGRTHNNPVDAARAVIAVEYLADELRVNPRWIQMSGITKGQMVEARQAIREVLGIRPDAPPQLVVNAMLGVIAATQTGNPAAAQQAVSGPAFTLPPPRTLAILNDLPFIRAANIATSNAADQAFGPTFPLR